jgi:hypothetical protein
MAIEVELRVKSGPGEIIADRKFAIVNNVVDITGIQFSDPGEYVISVVTNSPLIESSEFTINIEDEGIITQDNDRGKDEPPISGKRPIIAQIDQPSIKLEPIKFESSGGDESNSDIATSLGYTPLFSYNNTPIESRYISKMIIYYDDFVPKIEITFNDALGIINSPETSPLNDTKFDVFLNSGSDILKSIHLKFKLEINQKNKSGTNTITGVLDIPGFYRTSTGSYRGSSFNTIRSICKELGIGFNSNIENTDDEMTWRKNWLMPREFIRYIIEHSYISDESFMIGYIDYYWSFNYVDVEKEWRRDNTEDVGLMSQGIVSKSSDNEGDKIVRMSLTNDLSSKESPFFITNLRLNNNSTYQSIVSGNLTETNVYNRSTKSFETFRIDSQTSNPAENHVLKGAPGDREEFSRNIRSKYRGRIDTSNVHRNWTYAVDQNERNFNNLSNIMLEADLPNPNYNLYKYQKIKIIIINQKQTLTDPKILDERLSGDWIIIDITFIWTNGALKQHIICARKELGKTVEEKNEQVIEGDNSVNNSEKNENPVDLLPANTAYAPGETYTLVDSNGIRYIYTIDLLNENGIEVTGSLRREDGLDL